MKQNSFGLGFIWYLVIALITAVSLCLIGSPPAIAQTAEDYFQISYEPFVFSKTEIHDGEVFFTTAKAHVTCTRGLPISINEARITGRVIAEHTVTGAWVTLNSSYSINIKPFPYRAGETAEINKVIYLQFPDGSESGDYNVIGEFISIEVKIFWWWQNITENVPQEPIMMGSLKYIPGVESPTPSSTPTQMPMPTATSTLTVTPTPTATSTSTLEAGIGTGIWIGIGVAIISCILLISGIWLVKRRR
jgi:hypothetical protein